MKSKRRKKRKFKFIQVFTHTISLSIGCMIGIYLLPIMIAPEKPSINEFQKVINSAQFDAVFVKDLKESDILHWAKGQISLSKTEIAFRGKISPGPDYKLYLTKKFVQTKKDFLKIKNQSVEIGEIKSFNGFIISTKKEIDITAYNSVVIWCEAFSRFISAAKYQ
tara:strand:- start:1429 stop:1923 length:495 start_codon:yes stop_codon:yes gene_type:complete